jgi:hypothetical protein
MPPKKRLKNQLSIDSLFKRVNSADSESRSTSTSGQPDEETSSSKSESEQEHDGLDR